MSDKKEPNYDVGYKKPPKHTQFQPGSRGNAKGRPKGSRNLTTIVCNAINEKVVVTENGKRKSVSKLEVAIKQLVNKAASSDTKALAQLLPLIHLVEGRAEAAEAIAETAMAESDLTVMNRLRERIEQQNNSDTTKQLNSTSNKKEEHDNV